MKIERATMAECRFVYDLAVEPSVRRMSTDPRQFSFEEHQGWYASRIADPDVLFLIGHAPDGPVGYVRYARHGNAAEVAIAVARDLRDRGYARELLRVGDERAFSELAVSSLIALVLPPNEASRTLFSRAGYALTGSEVRSGTTHDRYERRRP